MLTNVNGHEEYAHTVVEGPGESHYIHDGCSVAPARLPNGGSSVVVTLEDGTTVQLIADGRGEYASAQRAPGGYIEDIVATARQCRDGKAGTRLNWRTYDMAFAV